MRMKLIVSINSNTKWIHILNQDNAFKDFTNFHQYLLKVDVKRDTVEQLKIIQNEKFDLIVLTDIFEVTKDIYNFKVFGHHPKREWKNNY